jgi:alkylation response protein AidB-like acyl-CoA dehydrogenase
VIFAARVLNDVIDRAVQAHGALGLIDQTPLAACTPTPALPALRRSRQGHWMVVSRRVRKALEDGVVWDFAEAGVM